MGPGSAGGADRREPSTRQLCAATHVSTAREMRLTAELPLALGAAGLGDSAGRAGDRAVLATGKTLDGEDPPEAFLLRLVRLRAGTPCVIAEVLGHGSIGIEPDQPAPAAWPGPPPGQAAGHRRRGPARLALRRHSPAASDPAAGHAQAGRRSRYRAPPPMPRAGIAPA